MVAAIVATIGGFSCALLRFFKITKAFPCYSGGKISPTLQPQGVKGGGRLAAIFLAPSLAPKVFVPLALPQEHHRLVSLSEHCNNLCWQLCSALQAVNNKKYTVK